MPSLEEFLQRVGASKDAGAHGGYNATYNIGGQKYYVPSDINHSRQYGSQLAALANPNLHQEYKDRAVGINPGGQAYGYLEGMQGAPQGGYRPQGGNAGYANQYSQHVSDPAEYQANMQRMVQGLQSHTPQTNALQNAASRRLNAPKMPGVESTATAPTTTSSVGTPTSTKAYSTYRPGRRTRGTTR